MNDNASLRLILQANKSLQQKKEVTEGLFFLENFISHQELDIIQNFINTTDKWKPYRIAHQQNRYIIQLSDWDYLNVMIEGYIKLTPHLKNIFKKTDLSFGGIALWQDRQKYYIAKHTDNPDIEIAVQIYLSENTVPLPTTFIVEGKDIAPSYKINSGYIMDNKKQLTHYLWPPIPSGEIRNSLYIIWKTT